MRRIKAQWVQINYVQLCLLATVWFPLWRAWQLSQSQYSVTLVVVDCLTVLWLTNLPGMHQRAETKWLQLKMND